MHDVRLDEAIDVVHPPGAHDVVPNHRLRFRQRVARGEIIPVPISLNPRIIGHRVINFRFFSRRFAAFAGEGGQAENQSERENESFFHRCSLLFKIIHAASAAPDRSRHPVLPAAAVQPFSSESRTGGTAAV